MSDELRSGTAGSSLIARLTEGSDPMQQITIERDAPVRATDGELGRVKHVVVDPTTREVTEIVVVKGDREWLIPMRAVVRMDGEAIILNGASAQFRAAPSFRRDQFEGV